MKAAKRTARLLALFAALLLTVMNTLPAAAQTMEEARAAYARGDHATALRGFRMHAERGDAEAQLILGLMYDKGEDIPQDHTEAARWYRRAAEQGHAGAQNNLGVMYEYGDGVAQDLVQAHKWYNLAASRASSSERELREKTVRSRDRVASRLIPADLAKAQRLAGAWQPREPAVEQPEEEERPSSSTAPVPKVDATDTVDIGVRIATLQRSLHRLGYDPGPVDSILGTRTKAAIRAFQADAGLPVTGQVSERLEPAVLAAIIAARQAPAPKPDPTHRLLE